MQQEIIGIGERCAKQKENILKSYQMAPLKTKDLIVKMLIDIVCENQAHKEYQAFCDKIFELK